ncbi:putative periplasmic binding protein-like I [Rosa chinensis]|uniref:Putative periplasmic binding protein-like I n=1 Tax=Rosa chinensis TaxID=74649 RepID=A0A2P6PZM8_ROSCH|nr:putative periplasmic binding protein-like I [Rosa chinensis]
MMSEGYVWIMTSWITNNLKSMKHRFYMDGVLGVETYVPLTKELQEFLPRWKRQSHEDAATAIFAANLDAFGLWAHDAAIVLAIAVEGVIGSTSSYGLQKSDAVINSTDLSNLPVSQYGSKLLKALSSVRFQGIAGNFSLVDGELQSSTFQIDNVIGGRPRAIGYWNHKMDK